MRQTWRKGDMRVRPECASVPLPSSGGIAQTRQLRSKCVADDMEERTRLHTPSRASRETTQAAYLPVSGEPGIGDIGNLVLNVGVRTCRLAIVMTGSDAQEEPPKQRQWGVLTIKRDPSTSGAMSGIT